MKTSGHSHRICCGIIGVGARSCPTPSLQGSSPNSRFLPLFWGGSQKESRFLPFWVWVMKGFQVSPLGFLGIDCEGFPGFPFFFGMGHKGFPGFPFLGEWVVKGFQPEESRSGWDVAA